MNQETALQNLLITEEVLQRLNVRHFITDGTLLGLVREGQFIEHDQDIDFAVLAEDFDYSLIGLLISGMLFKGFSLNSVLGNFNKHFELSFRRNQIKVDIFFYFRKENYFHFHAFQNGHRNGDSDIITYYYPVELVEPIQKATFYGNDIFVPAKTRDFLSFKYGDWKEVVKDWDWKFGPRNVLKNNKN